MFGPRHETSIAFVFTFLVLPCSAAFYGCSASADDDAIPRPDVVVIDGLSRLDELERPAVEFPHDQHTRRSLSRTRTARPATCGWTMNASISKVPAIGRREPRCGDGYLSRKVHRLSQRDGGRRKQVRSHHLRGLSSTPTVVRFDPNAHGLRPFPSSSARGRSRLRMRPLPSRGQRRDERALLCQGQREHMPLLPSN